MHKTRLLHIIDTLDVGGAEKLMIGVINGLPEFQHHVIYLSGADTLIPDLPAGVHLRRLNFKSKWDIPRCAISIRRYINKNKIEVVHSHLVLSTLIARLACPKRIRLFNTVHNLLGLRCFSPHKKIQRFIERNTYKKRHHIIAVSETVLKDYHQSIGIKGNYSVLHNFVEDHFFATDYKKMSFNGTLRMVSVGSLKAQKNYPYLIEAFKKLPKHIQLDIYGDGPQRKELQAAIDEHQLNIRLMGNFREVHKQLQQYDIFVMPSLMEGHPIALLEAMAAGLPAIMSDIPVLREATGNKGLYCNLNDINDFVTKIIAVAGHQVNLDEFAKENFEKVKTIASKAAYIQTLKKIYNPDSFLSNKVTSDKKAAISIFKPVLPSSIS